ncbi:MAG: hypothetical protein ACI8P3_003302 [Saprospiraceae bacterium]|jgi:uncharacterized protein (DUF1501 family)
MSKRNISRRQFIGEASCAAIGTTTLFSSILNLGMANTLASPIVRPTGTYKAMVCILLSGGNDSYNMLIPTGAEYGEYASIRSNLAIPQNEILGLSPITPGSTPLGLHPSMPEIQQLFQDGKVAFLNNVGTLIEPTTKTEIINQTAQLPLGLLSHSDQAMQWQTSIPQERSNIGWGGKMADIIQSMNSNQNISMNISLSGNNIFQTGNTVTPFTVNSDTGSVGILGYNEPDVFHNLLTSGVNSLLNQQYQDVFKKTYSSVVKNSIQNNDFFNDAIGDTSPFTTPFSDNYISESLHMIARTVAAHEALGMERQTFFLSVGGFDNHDELLNNQAVLLSQISAGLSEFYNALDEVSMNDCVTSYTISDFARSLTSNGNGTDHAWGGHAMVMGGAVNGQEIYGSYPTLGLGSDLEIGGGIFIPTLSADEYFAELALWFGVSPFDLPLLLPNIGNFYTVGSGSNPIGFMQT